MQPTETASSFSRLTGTPLDRRVAAHRAAVPALDALVTNGDVIRWARLA